MNLATDPMDDAKKQNALTLKRLSFAEQLLFNMIHDRGLENNSHRSILSQRSSITLASPKFRIENPQKYTKSAMTKYQKYSKFKKR